MNLSMPFLYCESLGYMHLLVIVILVSHFVPGIVYCSMMQSDLRVILLLHRTLKFSGDHFELLLIFQITPRS